MPKIINPIYATVTTCRSNSTTAFFDAPTDATPQDCKEVTAKLLKRAVAILNGVLLEKPLLWIHCYNWRQCEILCTVQANPYTYLI